MSTRTDDIDRKIDRERYNLKIEELINTGMKLLIEEKYSTSLMIFETMIKLNLDCPQVYCGQGYALGFLGRYQEALRAFDKAIQLDPAYPKAYCGRGEALHFLRRHKDALAAFDKAIQLNPDYESARNCKKMVLNFLAASNKDIKVATEASGVSQSLARSKGVTSLLSSTVSGNVNHPPIKIETTNPLPAFANHLKRNRESRTDNPVDSRTKP